MYIWSDQVVQFVQDAINDFDQQMALLVLQCGRHEQGQDLVEERPRAKLASFICDLPQSSLEGHGEPKILAQLSGLSLAERVMRVRGGGRDSREHSPFSWVVFRF